MTVAAHNQPEQNNPIPHLRLVPKPEGSLDPNYQPREHAVLIADFFKRSRIKAEDREFEYARMRRETVGYILTQAGVITEEVSQSKTFTDAVREAEGTKFNHRSNRLSDLADTYEDHPFSATINHLGKELGKSQHADHIIPMRRAGWLILEQIDSEN